MMFTALRRKKRRSVVFSQQMGDAGVILCFLHTDDEDLVIVLT